MGIDGATGGNLGKPDVDRALAAIGRGDALSKGIGQLLVDITAVAAASYGLYELFKKFPGEPFVKAGRKVLVSITDSTEKAITLLGFFGATTALGFHIGSAINDFFKPKSS